VRLLTALALMKVRRFLTAHLRLRTACDFLMSGDLVVTMPSGYVAPDEDALLKAVKAEIAACKGQFADPAVTEVETPVKIVKKKESEAEDSGAPA
jgi:hypothetical protein